VFFKIILKNILHKPLGTTLSVALLALSTGIISLLLLLQHQLEQKFENDLRDIDLVVGAKGSPLQLVLSAVYHVDAPTGNIPMAEVEKIRQMRSVQQVIPLAYGDSYQRFRILGTDTSYVGKYQGTLQAGRLFQAGMEAVVGATVARSTGLTVGQSFFGTHGEAEEGEKHDHAGYKVVGVLQETNSVLDNLILTNVASVWSVHEDHGAETPAPPASAPADHHDHDHAGHDHAGHDHDNHAHDDHDHAEVLDTMPHDVTAALVKARSTMAVMTLPRMLNETTNLQATIPALEINRLMKLLGIGVATLQALAIGIMFISGFSVFIALYNRLRERKYELALLRSLGCSRLRLFGLLLLEGLMLALAGFVGGVVLSRLGLWLLNTTAAQDFHLVFRYQFISTEMALLVVTLLVGLLAAFVPAIKAFRMNLSTALADA
jgi:putative ABC transport system permease protein